MSIRSCPEGDQGCQHKALLAHVRQLYRLASDLAEHTVADAWEDPAIVLAHDLMWEIGDYLYRIEQLEDIGQLPMES